MIAKTLVLGILLLVVTTAHAFEYPALASPEAEAEYHRMIAAWQDTSRMASLEPGAIDFTGGEIPINIAFNHEGENNAEKR